MVDAIPRLQGHERDFAALVSGFNVAIATVATSVIPRAAPIRTPPQRAGVRYLVAEPGRFEHEG
ncbi:hypothetical protein EGN69_05180 [Pseudomonas monteilii]|nr:hypothetical protein BGP83_04960 [Pseudomonas putida]POF98232.1 hypothetical protein BGP81_16500 [Pseudomonas putida]RPD95324.1 hypothetical protein EGN69_05180 [Pseudomonas monteilii]